MIKKISILSGHGRGRQPETFGRIDMTMGQVVSIVGPTGSGKTTLINDLELFADARYADRPANPDQRPAGPARVPLQPGAKPDRPDYPAHDVPLRSAGPRVPADAFPGADRRRRSRRCWSNRPSSSPTS